MACIAAIGESESFITRIVDCLEDETTTEIGDKVRYGKTPAEVEKIIKEFKPDIVGISATFSMFEKDATEVANMVKKIDSSIIIILGGVTATLPEIYISLLHNNDVYDIMSRGEGEYTFIDLLRNYNKKEKISFPLSLLDMSHEQWVAWLLKVYVLKPMYFYGMLKGLV